MVADGTQQCVPEALRFDTGVGASGTIFRRPQLTRYMRAFNSLGSLLYWKAAGRRTDGRTDDTYTTESPRNDIDIDFGPAHTTDITPEELGLLSRWIDIGAPGGPMELRDTQRPTLHLSAILDGGSVTELRVGTVDVGSGIDTESLEVCVLEGEDTCGPNLAPSAAPHGVVAIPLETELSDREIEVRARVRDLAGNETEVRRTVGWLLNTPAPPLPRPDGGPGGPGGPGSMNRNDGGFEGGVLRGECACRAPGASGRTSPGPMFAFGLALVAVAMRRRRRMR